MKLLVTDFDGTIAPIGNDVGTVAIAPAARRFLESTRAVPEVVVAIVSGRDVRDLHARTENLNLFRAGSHGLELLSPTGEFLIRSDAAVPEIPAEIIASAADEGLFVERKRHGTALHWRTSKSGQPSEVVVERFRRWAEQHDLILLHGRKVVEARVPGPLKRDLLIDLARRVDARRVFYCGDDLTDFPALEWAAEHGTGVLVASDERRERPRGSEVVRDLDELIRRMEEFTSR